MKSSTDKTNGQALGFDAINWVASDPLTRDMEQSRRLHEPESMITTIDPITGRDIEDLDGRPHLVDGNMVIYFESEDTRQAYLDTPMDHPLPLADNPDEDWVAEG